jgi:hypothetical protein
MLSRAVLGFVKRRQAAAAAAVVVRMRARTHVLRCLPAGWRVTVRPRVCASLVVSSPRAASEPPPPPTLPSFLRVCAPLLTAAHFPVPSVCPDPPIPHARATQASPLLRATSVDGEARHPVAATPPLAQAPPATTREVADSGSGLPPRRTGILSRVKHFLGSKGGEEGRVGGLGRGGTWRGDQWRVGCGVWGVGCGVLLRG